MLVRRRDRTPPDGVHEGTEGAGVVERVAADRLGQALVGQDGVPDLKLPHDRKLLAEPVLLKGLQADKMLGVGTRLIGRTAGQALLLDFADRPRRPSHLDDPPRLRDLGQLRGVSVLAGSVEHISQRRSFLGARMETTPCQPAEPAMQPGAAPLSHAVAKIATRLYGVHMSTPADRVRRVIATSGHSQGDFAHLIGLDASKMSKSLSGARRFTSLDFARIAEMADVSVDWLLTGADSPVATAARAAQGSSSASATEEADRLVEIREDLSFLGHQQPWKPLEVGELTGLDYQQGIAIAEAALERVRAFGESVADADLAGLVERVFGADVAIVALGDGFDGLAASTNQAKLILASPTSLPGRQRFTIAHELGHLLASDDQGIHADQDIFHTSRIGTERRANSFAASFLMPEDEISDRFGGEPVTAQLLAREAVARGVSPNSLAYRLQSLGLVDRMTCTRLAGMSWKEAVRLADGAERATAWGSVTSATRPPGLLAKDALSAYLSGRTTLRPYANLLGRDFDALRRDLEDVHDGGE